MTGHPVAAIIVNYNGGALLAAALDGLAAHAVDSVVVVDNASTDDSWRAAERNGVTLVRSSTNRGFAAAVNDALSRIEQEFVLLLNADVSLGDGYVDALRVRLAGDSTIAGATGVLLLGPDEIDSTGIEITSARWGADRDRGRAPEDASVTPPFGVSGAAALFRREALAEGLWETLFVYWEDVELAWRLRRAGWSFVVEPKARALHARGSDVLDPTFVEAADLRGRLATIARHEGVAGLLRPASALVTVVVTMRLLLRHPAALRRASAVSAVRHGLQARRADAPRGSPLLPRQAFSPHPWGKWLVAQLTGRRRGLGARRGSAPGARRLPHPPTSGPSAPRSGPKDRH